jgi:hypothetical protein
MFDSEFVTLVRRVLLEENGGSVHHEARLLLQKRWVVVAKYNVAC